MAVVLLASATGAPGVTTCALGLALAWPRDVVLVDADRDASQAILAGYLTGSSNGERALPQLIQPYRQGLSLKAGLQANLIPLPSAPNMPSKPLFLPGFTHPAVAKVFTPVWPALGAELAALDDTGTDVLVDCGRLGAGLPTGLLDAAAVLLLVVRSSLRSLVALHAGLRTLQDTMTAAEIGLVVVGAARPYSNAEISEQFDLPIIAALPWSPDEAAMFSDGAPPPRRKRETALTKAFLGAASAIQERAARRQALLVSGASHE